MKTINEKRIARITYNDRGWVEPSGREGKSKSLDAYEGKHGFGHEEWLFDFSKTIKSYSYGFIEAIYKNLQAYKGQTFDLHLFTLNHSDKVKYWIAIIRNCYVLQEDEIETISAIYNKPAWRKEREQQLKDLGLLTKQAHKGLEDFFPVIRFRKEDVEFFDPPIPITGPYINNLNRYQLFKWNEDIKFNEGVKKSFQFQASTPNNPLEKVIKARHQPRSKEVLQLHKNISVALYEHLSGSYGKENIGCDVPTGQGTYIDMVRRVGKEHVFYEIKTYNDLRKNIREAFGQLMEYAYWNNDKAVKEVVIVTDREPSKESREYLAFIRKAFKLPLYYQQLNLTTKQLSERY